MQDEMTQDQDLLEGPDLYAIIKDTCAVTGTLDYDQIITRLTKNTSPEAVVRDCLGLDEFTPEALLRHLIDDLLSPEDQLIWGCGISPEVAKAITAIHGAQRAQSAADDALFEIIESDLDAVCLRCWDETDTENPATAAQAMLGSMPVLAEGFRQAGVYDYMTERFADYYADFLARAAAGGLGGPEQLWTNRRTPSTR